MSSSLSDPAFKKRYYSDHRVANAYEDFRFSNRGGQYVHDRESGAIRDLLMCASRDGPILDMPVGTGRLVPTLTTMGFRNVVGADYSSAMLEISRTRHAGQAHLSRQDAFNTAFADAAFTSAVSLRFSFHCRDKRALLQELRRILKPHGLLVVDTVVWSPRSWTRLFARRLGGEFFAISDRRFRALARENGFEVLRQRKILLLPSFVYRFLPALTIGLLKWLEGIVPACMLSKSVWLLRREE